MSFASLRPSIRALPSPGASRTPFTAFRLSILVAVAFLPSLVLGATYYVDQTAGIDTNNGTTTTTPWKNCPGMSAWTGSASLQPGDMVYFDRGDTWMVSGSEGIHLVGGVTYVGNVWGTGSKATLRANADMDGGVVRFRDHATLSTIIEGFNIDANSKVTSGVNINHTFWTLMNRAIKRVKDCEVHHIWSNTQLSQYKYGIIVSNHGGTAGYAENVELINCVVHDTSRDGICLYPGDENANCRIKNILVRGCEVYNTGQDPNYGAGSGILVKGFIQDATIEYNYVHDTVGALIFVNGNETNHFNVGPTNIHFRYNVLTGNTIHGGIRIYDGSSGKDPKDIKVYGNLVYNVPNGGLYLGTDVGNTLNLLVYNNTFFNAPVTIQNIPATVTAFEFKNNIVYRTSGTPLTDSGGKITSHSNNIYYRGSGTLVSSGSSNFSSSNLTTYEATALSSNPLFLDTTLAPTGFSGTYSANLAPNRNGFSLPSNSPAINTGTALASGYAGSINSSGRTTGSWDIGAYEQTAVTPPHDASIIITIP